MGGDSAGVPVVVKSIAEFAGAEHLQVESVVRCWTYKDFMPTDPTVVPMISYEDGVAALDWLSNAFGFRERMRMLGPNGRLSHGELEAGDGLIMLASPTPEYESPRHHRETCEQARKWSAVPWIIDGVLVYVDDLDAHFARAKKAGAAILTEIEDGPVGRNYRAEDFEGHRWFFFERT